jgi:hypothetical protein
MFESTPNDDGSWNVGATFRRNAKFTSSTGDDGTSTWHLHGKGDVEFIAFPNAPISVAIDLHSGNEQGDGLPDYWVTIVVGLDGVVTKAFATAAAEDPAGLAANASGNPFEGSWVGTYDVPDLGATGVVEFEISKTGVLKGRSMVNEDGDYHTLIGNVNFDSSMRGVAIPNVHGYAQTFSGSCLIDDTGSMVCDLTGCIQYDCFDFVVTVSRLLDANESLDTASGAAGPGSCETGGYGVTAGGSGDTKAHAAQAAKDLAAEDCSAFCSSRGPCSASKPHCKGAVNFSRMSCGVVCGFGCSWSCSAFYTCTCSCSRNP